MSKKTHWNRVMSTEDWVLMEKEEKYKRKQEKKAKELQELKATFMLERMKPNKPKSSYIKEKANKDGEDY